MTKSQNTPFLYFPGKNLRNFILWDFEKSRMFLSAGCLEDSELENTDLENANPSKTPSSKIRTDWVINISLYQEHILKYSYKGFFYRDRHFSLLCNGLQEHRSENVNIYELSVTEPCWLSFVEFEICVVSNPIARVGLSFATCGKHYITLKKYLPQKRCPW